MRENKQEIATLFKHDVSSWHPFCSFFLVAQINSFSAPARAAPVLVPVRASPGRGFFENKVFVSLRPVPYFLFSGHEIRGCTTRVRTHFFTVANCVRAQSTQSHYYRRLLATVSEKATI